MLCLLMRWIEIGGECTSGHCRQDVFISDVEVYAGIVVEFDDGGCEHGGDEHKASHDCMSTRGDLKTSRPCVGCS